MRRFRVLYQLPSPIHESIQAADNEEQAKAQIRTLYHNVGIVGVQELIPATEICPHCSNPITEHAYECIGEDAHDH
jgi:hypothetical protein